MQVLSDSPWASTIAIRDDHAQNRVGRWGPTAGVVSALVVRQAIVRQHQLGFGCGPEQMKQDAICLNADFNDRIVFRFSGSLVFPTPPDRVVSGRKVRLLEGPKVGATTCVSDWGNDVAYPKLAGGMAPFESGKEKLVIDTKLNVQPTQGGRPGRSGSQFIPLDARFEFNMKNMVYKS